MPTADYSSFHQPSGTGADGTKYGNFIDAVQATVNGLDKNNLAAAAGILPAQLADPTTGKVLGSAGSACAAVFPPGYEFVYTQITAGVNITDTVEATATALITASSFTADGAPVIFEFFAPLVVLPIAAAGTATLIFSIFEGATQVGRIAQFVNPGATAAEQVSVRTTYRFTPTAAAHTYKVTAFVSTTTGTPSVQAASGGTGAYVPAFVRITKA